jgi:DNA-binding transcriptional regulator YiaG
MSQELRRKLKAARAALGLSQSKFAAHIGVPVQTLQRWEGDFQTPRGFTLKALEEKLDAILNSQK